MASDVADAPEMVLTEAGPRLLTVADLAMMPSELPSGPVRWDLCDGRITAVAPPGDSHGAIEAQLTTELVIQGQRAGHGLIRCGEVAIVLRRGPDRVVGADAVFIANRSLPLRVSAEGYLETIPDLIVEVRSKNDTIASLERKAGEYLAAGASLVWVVDPIRRVVRVYRAGHAPSELSPEEELRAEGIIPDFKVKIEQILA